VQGASLYSGELTDQAAGLRRLLTPANPVVEIVWATNSVNRAAAIRRRVLALRRQGRAPLVLDPSFGDLARAFSVVPRFELSHLLDGHTTADHALHAIEPGCFLLPSARALMRVAAGEIPMQDVLDVLVGLPSVPDILIIGAARQRANELAAWSGDNTRFIMVVDSQPGQLMTAYVLIKGLHTIMPQLSVSIWAEPAAMEAATQLSLTAERFLGLHAELEIS
jgi:hypothetical protein